MSQTSPLDAPTTSSSSSSNSKPHSSADSGDSHDSHDSDNRNNSNNAGNKENDDASSNGSVTPDGDETPVQYHRVTHQLESYVTGPHDDEEKSRGRTRAQTRALNQQQRIGLLSTLGLVAEDQIKNALIAKQAAVKKHSELPLGPVQETEPEPTTFFDACAFVHANLWEEVISFEFQGLLTVGTLTLVGVAPKGGDIVDDIWMYKRKTDAHGDILKAKARHAAKALSQQWGVDLLEIFSPAANNVTISLLAALANKSS